MRYQEFRDRWQAALRSARVMSHQDHPEETIELDTGARRWSVLVLGRHAEPFQVSATISFLWDPFESARSYTCEEDLLNELLGRRRLRSTQRRLVRVDIKLGATLPYRSTTRVPAADIRNAWFASVEEKLDAALTEPRRRKRAGFAWRGDLEIDARATEQSTLSLQGMSVSAFEMIVVPRIWDDPERRARERSAGPEMDSLAERFRGALDGWTASTDELAKWLRYAPAPPGGPSRRRLRGPLPDDGDAGPETTH